MAERRTRTLDRLLSRAGLCSRSAASAAIAAGRVTVNQRVVTDPEHWVDPARDAVRLDGVLVQERAREVWMLHKPVGYVTTASDERCRQTVYDLLPANHPWLAPVGRLDRDTSGLLLFTNDSDLANQITAPATKLPKTYLVTCSGALSKPALHQLSAGVLLSDGPTRPAIARCLTRDATSTTLELVLVEGRNRQVRRMIEAVGSQVLELHRSRIGPLELGNLKSGCARRLSSQQLRALRAAVSAPPPNARRRR